MSRIQMKWSESPTSSAPAFLFDRMHSVPDDRFLSQKNCVSLADRLARMAIGGGHLRATIDSHWRGMSRVGRNELRNSTDLRDTIVTIRRSIRGGSAEAIVHGTDDLRLEAGVRRTERFLDLLPQNSDERFEPHMQRLDPDRETMSVDEIKQFISEDTRLAGLDALKQRIEADVPVPNLFYDDTYNLQASARAEAIEQCLAPAIDAGMLASCYLEVEARGVAIVDTVGQGQYCPTTSAQFSVTVRSPDGTGSGWAGVHAYSWSSIDARQLCEIATDKCLRSQKPVAIEPGRYTTILEPQAVWDLCGELLLMNNRPVAEGGFGPYSKGSSPGNRSRLGERVFDDRITVQQDPMDPEVGFVPYGEMGTVIYPAIWIEKGVLKNLAYERPYGVRMLGENTGLPMGMGLRMIGGTTSIQEMIATTKRGIYITRFVDVRRVDDLSLTYVGYTRDGTWLIENGAITKPIKNFRFYDSSPGILNRVEQVGPASRIWNPRRLRKLLGWPGKHYEGGTYAVMAALKIRDFNLTALSDSI